MVTENASETQFILVVVEFPVDFELSSNLLFCIWKRTLALSREY